MPATTAPDTYLTARLLDAGYSFFDGYPEDRASCQAVPCTACGHQPVEYRALRRIDRIHRSEGWRTNYRAVAACYECGHQEEF